MQEISIEIDFDSAQYIRRYVEIEIDLSSPNNF